jgi:hemolysin III
LSRCTKKDKVSRAAPNAHDDRFTMSDIVESEYSLHEEMIHSLTHAFGLILSIVGLVLLMMATSGGGFRDIASCALYGTTLILVYSTSMLYHGVTHAESKRVLQTLDHVAIFLLIAGTYTPFVLIAMRGVWGWSLFAIVWTLAVLGVICELTRIRQIRGVMLALYIGMGWVGLIAVKPLIAAVPIGGLALVLGGGVSYTLGVIFYAWRKLRYHHAVWHVFVLLGSVLQYLAVLWYVLPTRT